MPPQPPAPPTTAPPTTAVPVEAQVPPPSTITLDRMDAATRADMQAWTGCVAGALTRAEFERALSDAGLIDVEIRATHRVHEHAASAIVRARKPPASAV